MVTFVTSLILIVLGFAIVGNVLNINKRLKVGINVLALVINVLVIVGVLFLAAV